MKKFLAAAILIVAAGCSLMKAVPSPGIIKGEAATSQYVVKMGGNSLAENIRLRREVSCRYRFFVIKAEVRNPAYDQLVIKNDDFTLKFLDGVSLHPLTRSEFCNLRWDIKCESSKESLSRLEYSEPTEYQRLVLDTESEIAACNLSNIESIIDGEMTIPGMSGRDLELIFVDDSFSDIFLKNQKAFLIFKDLPEFVLEGSAYKD